MQIADYPLFSNRRRARRLYQHELRSCAAGTPARLLEAGTKSSGKSPVSACTVISEVFRMFQTPTQDWLRLTRVASRIANKSRSKKKEGIFG